MRQTSILKSGCIVLLVYLFTVQAALSQEAPVWDKTSLRDSATALLSKYQILHNQLNSQSDSSVVWRFMHLFRNPKVQVIDDLEGSEKVSGISIEELMIKMADLFPDGLGVKMDLARLSMDAPKYDRNNRYIIRIRLHRSLSGISGGKVFSSDQKVIFQIAFFNNNGVPDNFTIYGMELPPKGQSFITAIVSPGYSGYINPTLKADSRLGLTRGAGYKAGIFYTRFFSNNWGVGSGVQFSQYSGSVKLDSFDAIGGFNSHLSNISIRNDLWFIEIPAFLSARTSLSKRFEVRADIGLSFGLRVFENMMSSAVNDNTGLLLDDVLSDAGWIDQMNRLNVGLAGNLSVAYRFNNRVGFQVGFGMRQGLSGLDSNVQSDFSGSKYQGQYNPLWGAPGKTVSQAFFINIGAGYRLSSGKEK